jgi:hypothetical protein
VVRFARDFKLLPEMVSLEELGCLFRAVQGGEWVAWWHASGRDGRPLPSRAVDQDGEVDLRVMALAGRLAAPAELPLSFE